MIPIPPALAYRRAATQQASVVGLVIALYDTLTGDLRKAIAAMERRDIEARVNYLKHGFAVLLQLESLVDAERGGQTAVNLLRFYTYLREQMLRAQFTQDPSVLSRLCTYVLNVREAWQTVDMKTEALPVAPAGDEERSPLDCLA